MKYEIVKAVGYTRVSSMKQKESGLSLELQDREIREYSKRNGLDLVEVISDPAESGKDLKREGILKLIVLCNEGEVGHVVVWSMDRLTRSMIDLQMLLVQIFRGNGVQFHSISQKIDTTTAMGRLHVNLLGSIDEWYRESIGEKTAEALRQKVIRGEPVGSPPYGYRNIDGKRFEKMKNEIRTIKYIKSLRRSGMSLEKIAETLNDQEIPTKRGGKWRSGTISYILNNNNYKKLSKKTH